MHLRQSVATAVLLACALIAAPKVSAQQAAGSIPRSGSRPGGRPEIVLQSGHESSINCIACTADGRYVVTGSDTGTVAIWEAASGRKLRVYLHTGRLESVAVSPDGQLLATAGYKSSVVIRRLETGEVLRQITTGSYEDCVVHQVAFSPDGRALLTGSSHDGVQLWDPQSGELIRKIDEKSSKRACFGPEGRTIVSGDYGGSVTVWETASGAKLFALNVIKGDGGLFDLALSNDGEILAVASVSAGEYELSLWEVASGKKLRSTSDARRRYTSVRFSIDGKWLLSGGQNRDFERQEVRRWDQDLEHLETLSLTDFYGYVACSECHPDGRRFFVGGGNRPVECAIESLKVLRKPAVAPDSPQRVALHPTRLQVLCQLPHAILSWEPAEERPRVLAKPAPEDTFEWLDVSPDGKKLLTWERTKYDKRNALAWQGHFVRRDLASGAVEVREPVAEREGGSPKNSTQSRNGRIVASAHWGAGSWDNPGSVRVVDARSGRLLRDLKGHSAHAVDSVAITADGGRILSCGEREAILWDAETGRELRRLGGEKFVSAVGLHPNGKSAVIGFDREAIVWNPETGETVATLTGHSSHIGLILYSRDAKRAATFGDRYDRRILLWDAAAWSRLGLGEGHEGQFYSASFSHDDRLLATSSTDATIRIWDAATLGELVRLVFWNEGEDWLVAAPDGRFDCSPGAREKFLFRIGEGLEVRTADDFESALHQPRLLAQILEEPAALAGTIDFPAELPNVFPLNVADARPWTNDERQFVRGICARAMRSAPGIWRRATAYRSVRFYRAASDASSDLTSASVAAANGIYLGDKFFDGNDAAGLDDKARTLLRGLVELIDGDLRLAGSKEWSEMIGPRIAEVRRDVANAGGQGFTRWLGKSEAAADEKRFHSLAVARELPDLSACIDLERALTECASERGSDYRPPPDIAAFLDEHLFRLPYAPEPRLKKFHEALELYAADDSRGPAAWDELVDDPTHGTRMRLWRGYWFQFKSKLAEAAEDYAAAAASFPADCDRGATTYALLGEVLAKLDRKQEALAAFDKAVISSVGARIPALVRRGFAYESWGEVSKAVDDYSKVIEAAPELTIAYEYRAAALTKLYRHEAAAADYSRLLELRPGDKRFLRGRADSCASAGKYPEALEDYEALLKTDPKRVDLLVARGKCRLDSGDFSGAAEDAVAVRGILPMPVPEAIRLRAAALVRSGNPELAVAEMDDLVARFKQDPFWRAQRAEVLIEAGEPARAIAELDELHTADPAAAALLSVRGAAYQAAGDYRRAREDYDAAVRLDDRRADGYLARSRLLATCPDPAVRDARQATDDAEKARNLLPAGDWRGLAASAAAYAELGNFATAVEMQEAALAAGPPPTKTAELREHLALYRDKKPFHEPTAPRRPAATTAEPTEASDAFELRLDVPENARIEIDGQDYGTRRKFSWKDLPPNETYVARAKVLFADGGTAGRAFSIQGGRSRLLAVGAPERIVYTAFDREGESAELYSVAADGTETKTLTKGEFEGPVRLSPDGRRIAYLRREEKSRTLHVIGADGTDDRELPKVPPAPIVGDQAWSPDGRRLAFASWSPGGSADLFVVDERTGLLRYLAPGYTPAWSPDGKRVVFGQLLKTQNELHVAVVAADGGSARTLVVGGYPTWSPDGTQIAFLQRRKAERRGASPVVSYSYLCLMRDDGTDVRTLAQADKYAWSPDGTALAFTTDEGLHVIQADGTGRRTLVRGAPSARTAEILSDPCWSPDGLRIAYLREFEAPVGSSITGLMEREFDASQLEVVDRAGGAPQIFGPRRSGWYETPDWK